jgi:hypothetical protein
MEGAGCRFEHHTIRRQNHLGTRVSICQWWLGGFENYGMCSQIASAHIFWYTVNYHKVRLVVGCIALTTQLDL